MEPIDLLLLEKHCTVELLILCNNTHSMFLVIVLDTLDYSIHDE